MAHPYSSLNLGAVDDARDILPENEITISSHPSDTIRIFTAHYGAEFVYGYQFVWQDGRSSFRNPSPTIGRFRTETDAVLHCIGFFKHYRDYFHPDTFANILEAERKYLKPVLPLV